MSKCIVSGCVFVKNIPLFSFPKNEEKLKDWEKKIFPIDGQIRSKEGDKICIRHFEKRMIIKEIHGVDLLPNAIPTLELNSKGNTVDDFEELLLAQKPMKKKRGSSGLKNLQIAREKRNMRKERMKRIAEMRRLAKLQSDSAQDQKPVVAKKPKSEYDRLNDFFLGDREETEHDKILISLRLPHLRDNKNALKHPSSIRNVHSFPLLNSIKHLDELINNNPVFWDTNSTLSFIQHFIPLKSIVKRFQAQEVTGETILNLTKADLIEYLKLDEKSASLLGEKFAQLRKETILRYINN